MDFKKFKNIIRNLGGVWSSEDVYFSKTQSTYTAKYAPKYPESSSEDSTINILHFEGMWYYDGPHTKDIPHY